MESQKHLFQLPPDIHYLNCGYMSPLLRSVEEAGIKGMQRKRDPSRIIADDFFNESTKLRQLFAQLVNCNEQQVAIIPSASYGLKNALNNTSAGSGKFAITVSDEFPSDYFTIERWCEVNNKDLKIIDGSKYHYNKGKSWNEDILNSITSETSAVILSSIHWTDGTLFDLKAIGKRCKEVNAIFIVDGTQSVGALPIDVTGFDIDVLVCAGYKWLLGPYSIGAAYYSEQFNKGIPMEESWMNRVNANDFTSLTNYADQYQPGAARYNVGEFSNFALTPMFIRSLEQILSWKVKEIQDYCRQLIIPLVNFLKQKGAKIEEDNYRASHLFGFKLEQKFESGILLNELQKRKIFVSLRGDSIRVSTHVYNTPGDIDTLIDALTKIL